MNKLYYKFHKFKYSIYQDYLKNYYIYEKIQEYYDNEIKKIVSNI